MGPLSQRDPRDECINRLANLVEQLMERDVRKEDQHPVNPPLPPRTENNETG
ncbi:hypothetical protein TorRG33x02_186810, partial [Trema orientale]